MTYPLIIAGILIFVLALILIGRMPKKHKDIPFHRLSAYLGVLLKRGHDGGFMVARLQKNRQLGLQFSKYFREDGKGIQLDFPIAPWSKPFEDRFFDCLRTFKLNFQTTRVQSGDKRVKVVAFITVDFGRDLQLASEFSQTVFQQVFGADQNDMLFLYYGNVDPRDIEV